MARWVMIDNHVKEIADEPWSMYWTEWKSDHRDFANFLINPLPTLVNDLKGVRHDFHVSTDILNHEIAMNVSAVCTVAIVMHDEKKIKLMLYKHRPDPTP